MSSLSKNEIITLEHLSDGKDHDDAPKGLTDAQFYTALKSLQAKQMVRAAFITGGEVCSSHILNPGQAALDDLLTEDNSKQDNLSEELMDEELKIIEFLADGKEHFDEPEIDDYIEICEYLSEQKLVNLGETKDEGIKLTYKGKRLWKKYQRQKEENMEELEYLILNILRLHGKKIDPQIKPSTQVYDFEELSLYTKEEITECSLRMQEKGWIVCFVDHGPAYWHKLKDKGLVALRNYIKKHPQNTENNNEPKVQELPDDKELIEALLPSFYGNTFRQNVIDYIDRLRQITDNPEKVAHTAKLVKEGVISDQQCNRPLWTILNKHGLYPLKEGTWNKTLKNYL